MCTQYRVPAELSRAIRDQDPPLVDAYDAIGDLYDPWVVSVTEDVDWYAQVADRCAAAAGRPITVLELGAGSGRISLPIARRGHRVIALDSSLQQLAALRSKLAAEETSGTVVPVHGDLRSFRPDEPVDLVVAAFRTLMHVPDEQLQATLEHVASLLRPGGQLAFDVFHPSGAGVLDDSWLLRRRLEHDGDEWEIWERAVLQDDDRILELRVRCVCVSTPERSRESRMPLAVRPAEAWQAALEGAGFEPVERYGWFDTRAAAATDDDSVWLARRQAQYT